MAVIQYSGLVNQVRGKLNGSTLSRNRGINTIYRKGQPARYNTVRQSGRRSIFAFVQRSWKQQPEYVRQDYALAAQNNPTTDRFGGPKVLSAYAMWMRVNIKYFAYWDELLTNIDSSPAPAFTWDSFEIIEFEYQTPSAGRRSLSISWEAYYPPFTGSVYMALYVSPPFSSGQSEFYGTYYFEKGEINPVNGTDGVTFPVETVGGEASEGESVKIRIDFFWADQGIRVNRFEYIQRF